MAESVLHGPLAYCYPTQISNRLPQALDKKTQELRGVIVCKLENHRGGTYRGYIAMLAVEPEYRGQGIATKLVRIAVDAMDQLQADEVWIEIFAAKGC